MATNTVNEEKYSNEYRNYSTYMLVRYYLQKPFLTANILTTKAICQKSQKLAKTQKI